MKKDNLKVLKHIILIITFIILLIIFFSLLFATKDNKRIKNIKEYIKTDTKVLYISDKKNYDKYPIDLFIKYEIPYLYINSDTLSIIEKSKLEKIINSKYLTNIIVVFRDGKRLDALIEFETEDNINKFLQKYDIIPEIIGDNTKIIDKVTELLETDYTLMYIPYEKTDNITYQNTLLTNISANYEFNYNLIEAYLLSNAQKDKLNAMLQISSVDDQIVVLVKNKKIVGSIREEQNRRNFLSKLREFGFIDEIENRINYIDFNQFMQLIKSAEKNVIVIGKDDCKYCEDVLKTLSDIPIDNDMSINYINIGELDAEVASNVEKELSKLKYKDGLTTPLTILTENNSLLDYVVGLADEDYFVDIFTENGIIK